MPVIVSPVANGTPVEAPHPEMAILAAAVVELAVIVPPLLFVAKIILPTPSAVGMLAAPPSIILPLLSNDARWPDVRLPDVVATFDVLPLIDEICVPAILKTLPVPAVSNVLFVSVSVVALPTSVSVAAGNVRVPVAVTLGVNVVVPDVLPDNSRVPSCDVAVPIVSAPPLIFTWVLPDTALVLVA